MNASALRYRSYVRPALLAIAIALMSPAFAAHASDRADDAPAVDPGTRATNRVTDALTVAIDAAVATHLARTSTGQRNLVADHDKPAAPRRSSSVAGKVLAPSATATIEHTRLYLAIKDGAESGVLVQ